MMGGFWRWWFLMGKDEGYESGHFGLGGESEPGFGSLAENEMNFGIEILDQM